MTIWALENAIETAGSMKSRGYGHTERMEFSIFTFDKRDKKDLLYIVILGIYTLAGKLAGEMYFRYFPSFKTSSFSIFWISVFISYFALCMCPIIIEIREEGEKGKL